MNMQSAAWTTLHDELMKVTAPGRPFAYALAWCEDYMETELARETPDAAREAVRAFLRERAAA